MADRLKDLTMSSFSAPINDGNATTNLADIIERWMAAKSGHEKRY
jgi:hypothetical protein